MGDLFHNSTYPQDIKLGAQQVSKIMCGNVQVWPRIATGLGYGRLYNWYAATDPRNIAANGWHVPTKAEWQILFTFLATATDAKLRETGLTHWRTPNTGATNSSGFTAVGNGYRTTGYLSLTIYSFIWASTSYDAAQGDDVLLIFNNAGNASFNYYSKSAGHAIRLLRNSTTLSNGQKGTYTGNDGQIYATICIGTQEWISSNLKETKYSTGVDIPNQTDGVLWYALTSGAWCAYNNDNTNI